jgi:two-component system OmpR family sensor kinase
MNSIRRHLLLALLIAMTVVMLAGGWATYRAARDEAGSLFDYQLQQIALSLRDQTFRGPAEALASDESLDYVIRVWDLTGLRVYYSRPHQALPELTRLGYSTSASSEGDWRVFALQYHGLTIAVAQPMRVRNQLAADAAWSTLKPFFVLLPALALLIWIVVSRGLRPLAQLARSVQARTPDSLAPLAVSAVPEEVRPLVLAVNDLLARLKAALAAQRAFVADAAHELRTPLTALQLQLQLVERTSSDADRAAALAELKSGLVRSTHAVEQLLTLARHEPGAAEYRCAQVALAAVARDVVVELAPLANARQIDLGLTQADAAALVTGDSDALRVLLSNLVVNALRYTPAGGRVDVACSLRDGSPCIEVADTGPGIPAAERERVFDRFYRRGADDAGSIVGSGLGLSIVRIIAERHGAQVSLADADSGGLLARVVFPPFGGGSRVPELPPG